eukprot:2455517-Prymnesium_polylepis.1
MDVIMWGQLRDKEAGVAQVIGGAMRRPAGTSGMRVDYETKLSAKVDGQQQHGILVTHHAVQTAIDKAQKHGVGLVGTRNTSATSGALGYYLESVAQKGLVGLIFAQSGAAPSAPELVALGVSVPSARGPVVLDVATAAANVLGLQDAQSVTLSGAARVFDEAYKGSHLSVMVELLAGPLVGAAAAEGRPAAAADGVAGNLVLAFDPELLGDKDAFMRDVEAVLRRVKGAAPAAGYKELLLPGEQEARAWQANLDAGNVAVDEWLLSALKTAAAGPAAPAGGAAPGDYSAYGLATRLCHPKGKGLGDPYNASSPVLYQTATFEQPSATEGGEYDYTRSGNPTRKLLELQMADLEGADRSFAFTSGML